MTFLGVAAAKSFLNVEIGPKGAIWYKQVVHVRLETGISQIARKLYSKLKKKYFRTIQ